MKQNKRQKLSARLILMLLGVAVGIILFSMAIGWLLLNIPNVQTRLGLMYIMGLVDVIAALFLFVLLINKYVVKRIRSLNQAVSEIAKGNYDLSVPVKGNDELSELTENFNKMTGELKANTFLNKDFARYYTHEFKTPLSVIRSYAEAVQLSSSDEETASYMGIIISETDRLAGISKNILELCKLDSTTIIKKEDTFSPAVQIRSAIVATQLQWESKNISIEPELDEFEIKSNESLVFRIWENLIGNAVKFTAENGKIKLTLEKINGNLLFSVTDNGAGIADEDKDKIFNPFFTGDKSHNKEGSGLGLPLTKNIVEKLGGDITFTSERGKGTTFSVMLPMH